MMARAAKHWWRGIVLCPVVVAFGLAVGVSRVSACTGDACMNIWSDADGGGALHLRYDFSVAVRVFESFCNVSRSSCLFTAIDPGFMAPPVDAPPSGLFRVVDGTVLRVELVAVDAGLLLGVNGTRLSQAGESAVLGTMPSIHVHPSWQIVAPGDSVGQEWNLSLRIKGNNGYAESETVQARVVVADSEPTPSPTPRPTVPACVGDCNQDGAVSLAETVLGMELALTGESPETCTAIDFNDDDEITVDELSAAVHAAAVACPAPPVATLNEIQSTIFTPKCATLFCHDSNGRNGNLVLEPATSFDQLVGVNPSLTAARNAGLLRVAPGDGARSFLMTKLLGPPPTMGSPMPLGSLPLSDEEIDLIRRWILGGATR